jgi:glycosyltransferase involved in cell wall biosynthesis
MTRVALLSSEPVRARMAGIGIRYLELARRLPAFGVETVLLSPGLPEEVPGLPAGAVARRAERGRLAELTGDCQAAVAQGQWANDLLLEAPNLPVAIDLYDPWLVENLHYTAELGLDPYRNDHASWLLQLGRGDFFLCSGMEQRLFYQGFLAAVGRVNPLSMADDPDLGRLIAEVPFGVPEVLPPHRPYLPPRAAGERRFLFGGLYDWYDPWTVLRAFAAAQRPEWRLYFIHNPNPESTPQRLWREVEGWCRRQGLWGTNVLALDWVEAERRYDLLRDVDALVVTHLPSLETRLSLRTRLLDALAAGCPVVTSEGGAMGRLLVEHRAGWVVPCGDVEALGRALAEVAAGDGERAAGAAGLARRFAWETVLEPLVAFCLAPRRDSTKDDFALGLATRAPADSVGFRLRRWLRAKP